ncbi:MAG: tetratricopeptide repeat protein, partial [Candidatus Obscuribacterales bacterium]|nr:tetratricopeptide repeat protein [Candidatus Obscuribacterales bacterium]
EVANLLNNLGELYRSENRLADAEPQFEKALEIYQKAEGNNGANVANTSNNLALVYHMQKKNAEAEALYKRAVSIYETKQGSNVALENVLENYKELLLSTGRSAEANAIAQRINNRIAQNK